MTKITIGFSTSSQIKSRLIRFITKAPMSHAYIKIHESDGNVVFHADDEDVHYMKYDHFLSENKVIEEIEIEISDAQAKIAETLRVTEIGKPYSRMKLFGFIWIRLLRLFNVKTKNPFYDDGRFSYICVEIVTKSLGIQDETTLTPVDLYNVVKENNRYSVSH